MSIYTNKISAVKLNIYDYILSKSILNFKFLSSHKQYLLASQVLKQYCTIL